MKKFLTLMLSGMMALALLAGCGGDAGAPSGTAAPSGGGAESGSVAEGAALNIVIVTSPSGVDDGSFNQDVYNGIMDFIAENPNSKVTPIQEGDINNSVPAVEAVLADYDVIVTPGFQFAGITTLAQDNTDKKFILVDSFPSDAEGAEVEVENIYAMQFAEQESGFFAGVAAAMQTETGKVAVVNGIAYPSNVNYQYGFMAGVNYAVAHLDATAEIVELPSYAGTDVTDKNVGGNYVGDFNDPVTGKVVGEALLAEGVDIIFVAAGNSGNGVFTAVKENGNAFVIGCDVDQYDDGTNGADNIVLTSVLKNMRINVYRQLNAIADESFTGGNVRLYADSDSTGYVSEAGRQQLSDETLTTLADLYEQVKNGVIVPPHNFSEGSTPTEFPGL